MESIPVLFCADDRYFPHLGATISSLLASNPRNSFRLIVCSGERSAVGEAQLASFVATFSNATLEFIEFDLQNWTAELAVGKHITLSSYLRLFASEFLDPAIERILYLDCDVIVRGDVGDLWRTDVSGFYAAAAPEPYRATHPGFTKDEVYFNAGVLLINLRKWREDQVLPRLLQFAIDHAEVLTAHDQDVLNNVFRGRILPISTRWNFQPNFADFSAGEMGMSREEFERVRRAPMIIHYTGKTKPWLYMEEPHYKSHYREAASRTPWAGRHLADRTPRNIIRKTIRLQRMKERANWYFPQLCRAARNMLGRRSRVDVDPAVG